MYQNISNNYYTERSHKGLFKGNKYAEMIEFQAKIDLYYNSKITMSTSSHTGR